MPRRYITDDDVRQLLDELDLGADELLEILEYIADRDCCICGRPGREHFDGQVAHSWAEFPDEINPEDLN